MHCSRGGRDDASSPLLQSGSADRFCPAFYSPARRRKNFQTNGIDAEFRNHFWSIARFDRGALLCLLSPSSEGAERGGRETWVWSGSGDTALLSASTEPGAEAADYRFTWGCRAGRRRT